MRRNAGFQIKVSDKYGKTAAYVCGSLFYDRGSECMPWLQEKVMSSQDRMGNEISLSAAFQEEEDEAETV